MSRRGASSSLGGVLVLLGVLGWVLSQVWVYLVVGCAAVLAVWVIFLLSRSLGAAVSRPKLVVVQAPRAASPPESQYASIMEVDRAVFDDAVLAEAAALNVFRAWMRAVPMAPADPTELVQSIQLRNRHVGRLVSQVGRRVVSWQKTPFRGGEAATPPRIALERVDPWAMSPEELKQTSRHIAACEACDGKAKLRCASCQGTTRMQCPDCNGAGKAYGFASNGSRRLMNCKRCAKAGVVSCGACSKGLTSCAGCEAAGKFERWLAIDETTRTDVQVEPDGAMTRAFRWGADGVTASRAEIQADAIIIGDTHVPGSFAPSALEQVAPSAWLQDHWAGIQPKLQPGERVQAQEFWMLEVPSIEVAYALPRRQPTVIGFEGCRMLAPPPSRDEQLAARASRLRLASYVLGAITLLVPVAYAMRGPYFRTGWLLGLTVAMLATALSLRIFLRDVTLGRRVARRWGIASLIAAGLTSVFALKIEPSMRAASRMLMAGLLEEARAELTELGDPRRPDHASAWADLHLAKALGQRASEEIGVEVAQIPVSSPQRQRGNTHLLTVVEREVAEALSHHDPTRAAAILGRAAPVLGNDAKAVASELAAQVHDEAYAACKTEECRWEKAQAATRAAPRTDRARRLSETRAAVISRMEDRPGPRDPALERLQRLNGLLTLARAIFNDSDEDKELHSRAQETATWASAERAALPILGAAREVAASLLGTTPVPGAPMLETHEDGVAAICIIRNERCAGVYIAPMSKRVALNDPGHAQQTIRTYSQALGHEVRLPDPPRPGSRATVSSRQNGAAVTTRWSGQDLLEIRIGDAKP